MKYRYLLLLTLSIMTWTVRSLPAITVEVCDNWWRSWDYKYTPPNIEVCANIDYQSPPSNVNITVSNESSVWRGFCDVHLNSKDVWIEAAFTGDITGIGVQFTSDSYSKKAKILVDGNKVWEGSTFVFGPYAVNYKTVNIKGLEVGSHTIRIINTEGWKVRLNAFGFWGKDKDGDGVEDDDDLCADSDTSVFEVDEFGCTPEQKIIKILEEYHDLNLDGCKEFKFPLSTANGSWNNIIDMLTLGYKCGTKNINTVDGETVEMQKTCFTGGITCSEYQQAILRWLDGMRVSKQQVYLDKDMTYADLLKNVNYGPIQNWMRHLAVVIYPSKVSWPASYGWTTNGTVLDPWYKQEADSDSSIFWIVTNPFAGAYDFFGDGTGFPIVGGSGYKPLTMAAVEAARQKRAEELKKLKTEGKITGKVTVQITDKTTGKKLGIIDNEWVKEIQGADLSSVPGDTTSDGTVWNLSLPEGNYKIEIIAQNGANSQSMSKPASGISFNVALGIKNGEGILDYGDNSITEGTTASITLKTGTSTPTLILPGGNSVTPVIEVLNSELALSKNTLNFGTTTSGTPAVSQDFTISNTASGILDWTVTDDRNWLLCNPSSGTGPGTVTVTVDPAGLSAGVYTGTITVSDPNASNSPQTVPVTLTVYAAGKTAPPFGDYSTPENGSTVSGSIAVTGWVLDDVGVESVKIYSGQTYIGDAVFAEGARPDIETAYPGYPQNDRAGWGYMLLTHFLPGGGNGTYTLKVVAVDIEGKQATLGSKTVTVDNLHAVKPFGAIDTPAQGGSASGSTYKNQGWVLTPLPNKLPEDGSTIDVYVDGKQVGKPRYNIARSDIAGYFPGYANSDGPAAVYTLDTTAYTNGIHSIFWIAEDNAGNADGIGSRFFSIENLGSGSSANNTAAKKIQYTPAAVRMHDWNKIPVDRYSPIWVKKGIGKDTQLLEVFPDDNGVSRIAIKELDRVEIRLSQEGTIIGGCTAAGDKPAALPIGSTLDISSGTFYWQAAPGFIGQYRLVFFEKIQDEEVRRKEILVMIKAKFP